MLNQMFYNFAGTCQCDGATQYKITQKVSVLVMQGKRGIYIIQQQGFHSQQLGCNGM